MLHSAIKKVDIMSFIGIIRPFLLTIFMELVILIKIIFVYETTQSMEFTLTKVAET